MNDKQTINVLIVDDSQLIIDLLSAMLQEADDINIIGSAKDGQKAVELAHELKPDLITMDINMPILDGFEATKRIMSECPIPIIVISSHVNDKELNTTFNALQAGALTVIEKPKDVLSSGFAISQRNLIDSIRALSDVRVIKHHRPVKIVGASNEIIKPLMTTSNNKDYHIVALGISTGGPQALNYILSKLPSDFPVPIVIVQHMTKGFLSGLVTWLQKDASLTIKIAQDGQLLEPGCVYFAPDDYHLTIQHGEKPTVKLDDSQPVEHFKPSVMSLFNSLAENYPNQAVAGLLTGMGRDGAQGLLSMKEAGCYTFIQDEASSVVFGMPSAAQALNAMYKIVGLDEIPEFISKLLVKENEYGK